MTADSPLALTDPDVWAAVLNEQRRQTEGLELIASENYTSAAVLQAAGTVLTNKYAEGYPGRRYYGGCEYVDVVETLARDRACQLFGAEHANVQPHSGSQANMAVYLSVLQPGDTFLAMDLAHGGHLTHGMHLNFSGKLYNVVHYGVRRDDHRIDFDQVARLASEHKPKLIVAGASAYPREIEHAKFAEIARRCGGEVHGRHGPLRRAGGGRAARQSGPGGRLRHHHDAQDAAGPAVLAWCSVEKSYAKDIDKTVFPGLQGGPLDARHRRQGGLLRRGAAAGLQGLRPADRRQCQGPGRDADRRRADARPAAAPTTT